MTRDKVNWDAQSILKFGEVFLSWLKLAVDERQKALGGDEIRFRVGYGGQRIDGDESGIVLDFDIEIPDFILLSFPK